MDAKYAPLFESIALSSGVEIKNRIAIAPMTHSSSNEDGTVSDAELAYYARRSGGVGMVITACTYVIESGIGFPRQFAADRDDMIPSLRRLATTIQKQGAKAVLQIFHGGRMCSPKAVANGDVVSASAVAAEREGAVTPRALETNEIEDIVNAFGETTRRAIEAGFDGVEIHGANGYLLQQFFSPHSNRRTDEYGGTLENRMRFPLAVVKAVTDAVTAHASSPFLVGYRFSPEEPTTPGIEMDQTLALVDRLAELPLDYLHVSLHDYRSQAQRGVNDTRSRIELLTEQIRGRVPLMGVGSIISPDDALATLELGAAFAALGREIIVDPDWVEKVQTERTEQIDTTLTADDQERLVVPDPLWRSIMTVQGWFPVADNGVKNR